MKGHRKIFWLFITKRIEKSWVMSCEKVRMDLSETVALNSVTTEKFNMHIPWFSYYYLQASRGYHPYKPK